MIYATEQQIMVTSALVAVVALVALAVGVWWGSGREREYVKELEEEVEERTAALGMLAHMPAEIAHDRPWPVSEAELDAAVARHPAGKHRQPEEVLTPTAVLSPEEMSWTGEIAKMTAKFERDIGQLLDGTDEQLKEITR